MQQLPLSPALCSHVRFKPNVYTNVDVMLMLLNSPNHKFCVSVVLGSSVGPGSEGSCHLEVMANPVLVVMQAPSILQTIKA